MKKVHISEAETVIEDSATITTSNQYEKLVSLSPVVAEALLYGRSKLYGFTLPIKSSSSRRAHSAPIIQMGSPRLEREIEQHKTPITTVSIERHVSSSTHAKLRQPSITSNNSELFDLQSKSNDKKERNTEFSQFKTDTALSGFLVRGLKSFPQPQGIEEQKLTRKLDKVTGTIQDNKQIQRLPKPLEKIDEKRNQALHHYLEGLRAEAKATGEREFTELVVDVAWQVWEKLRNYFLSNGLCLEVPDACPGQRNNFMYTWSKGEHYFECEVFGSKQIEFFYRNRNSGEVWGEDTILEQEFSTAIFDKAALFARKPV